MSDNISNKGSEVRRSKGIEFLTLALIGFLAIITVLLWAIFQVGTRPAEIVERTEADIAISNLESAKRTVSDALLFSSHSSSLEIAAAGGTLAGAKYWWCQGRPTPPEPVEVLWAVSNRTLSLYNVYVNETKKVREDIDVTLYSCAGVYDAGYNSCAKKDSKDCEYWNSSATGGTLGIESENIRVFYNGNVAGEPKNNRFWWMYYVLYKAAKENLLVRAIQQGFQSNCNQEPTQNMRAAIDFAIELLEKQFDEYVECTYTFKCGPDTTMECLNEECETEFTEQLCYDVSGRENLGLDISSLQAGNTASATIEIKCVDHKYRIPSEKGTEEMTWILLAVVSAGGECRPIDVGVGV